jgi:integrase
LVIGYASQVFTAAVEEGIIVRNPLAAPSSQKPAPVRAEAVPWTEAEIEAVADHLPARYAAMSYLGAAVGLRQGELFRRSSRRRRLPAPHHARRGAGQVRRRMPSVRSREEQKDA